MPETNNPKHSPAGLVLLAIILVLVGGGAVYWRLHPEVLERFGAKTATPPTTPETILRLHGSNTIGAQLAGALAEAFLKQQGAQTVWSVTGPLADEFSVHGTIPGDPARR